VFFKSSDNLAISAHWWKEFAVHNYQGTANQARLIQHHGDKLIFV
jgi:hypothetical protein